MYYEYCLVFGVDFQDCILIVLSEMYFDFLIPNGDLHLDEYFLKYKLLEVISEFGGLELGYAFKTEIQNAYFWPNEMGHFTSMIRGLKDVKLRVLIM